ncbi:hypothetical protein MHYP_G00117790 [Metynnis hypsauchen]
MVRLLFVHNVIKTFKGQFCKCSLSRFTKCQAAVPSTTVRVTAPRARATTRPDQCCLNFATSKIPDTEVIKVEKTPSDCPKQGYVVTTSKGKFCMEEDVLASFTQQQITEPPGFSNVTTPSELNKTEDVRASTTQQHSTVETMTFRVPAALSEFCML